MTSKPAIRAVGLTKRYHLFGGPVAHVLGSMGIRRGSVPVKTALADVDLTIQRGEKVGIIGRNGSGKTTLLRLVIGRTERSHGQLEVNGTVQALMQTGFGFHDEVTGIDNVRHSLIYNGLTEREQAAAVADIVDFVELDGFLEQPLKTYSLGMRARLEFATATAIHPEILAIDEVLGAGDGYFIRKCAERMRRVVANSTLLLVSHSLDQIRQYCERAVWLDDGRVVEDGPVDRVLKNYQLAMAQHEEALPDDVASDRAAIPDAGDERRTAALARAREIFAPVLSDDPAIEILACEFDPPGVDRRVIETGEPITATLTLQSEISKRLEPLLVGLSEHGAFMFEAVAGEIEVSSRVQVRVHHPRAGIGVGNYFLVPALRHRSDGQVVALGPAVLTLKVLPTNWSDPPLAHLEAAWRSGAGQAPLEAKISSWV